MTGTRPRPVLDSPGAAPAPAPAIEIDPYGAEPPLRWADVFGNDRAVEIEIGSGKGMFLRESARLHPERNYLGVERASKYYRHAVARITRAGCPNVRLLRADGLDVLARWVPPASVTTLHVLFPDPWPKKRHHKRRIFRPEFMPLAHRALPRGGELRVATDHSEYRDVIERLLAGHARLFLPLPWPGPEREQPPTNYSLKWARLGRPLWWARYAALAAGERAPGD